MTIKQVVTVADIGTGLSFNLLTKKIEAIPPEKLPREYYVPYTSVNKIPISALTPTIAGMGFSAVGAGASVTDAGVSPSALYKTLKLTAPRASVGLVLSTAYIAPTSFVLHTMPVPSISSLVYGLEVVTGGAARRVAVEIWICNSSGVPSKRIYAQTANDPSDSNVATVIAEAGMGPDSGSMREGHQSQWLMWEIPKSLIAQYVTAGMLKIAIRPASGNGGINDILLRGFSLGTVVNSCIHVPTLSLDEAVNLESPKVALLNGNTIPATGVVNGYSVAGFPWSQNRLTMLPVPDVSGDLILGFVHLQRNTDSQVPVLYGCKFSLVGPAFQEYALGRLKVNVTPPFFYGGKPGLNVAGLRVPLNVLNEYAYFPQPTSGVKYLKLRITSPVSTPTHQPGNWAAVIIEKP